jgi:hypothetical protein
MAKQTKRLIIETRHVYNSEIEVCPHCESLLRPQGYYQWRKPVQQLTGTIYVAHRASECVQVGCSHVGQVYPSARAQRVTLPGCSYGRDVIAQIGWWRERQHWERKQIHQELQAKVQISEREVDYLYNRYEVLRGCLEQAKRPQLFTLAQERGGLLLGLDGLSPEGANEQMWTVYELQSGLTLTTVWLSKVDHSSLAGVLQPVIALGLPILATISDKQPCVEKALNLVLPDTPHQWCQSHYLGHTMDPVYERDLALKTQMRQEIRHEIRPVMAEILGQADANELAAPQMLTGALADDPPLTPPSTHPDPRQAHHVVRDLALDIKQALTRQGRAPFNLSGNLMCDDLLAIQDTLASCLQVAEDPHLHSLHTTLNRILPNYTTAFQEVTQAQAWSKDIATILDVPLLTPDNPGPGADAVALQLAHYLGHLADQPDLSSWLKQTRSDLFALTDRYWSGLFPCYHIPGLPRTNNDLESLFGQTKRQLRRRLGISQLREPLLRHAAWASLPLNSSSPTELCRDFDQVNVAHYQRERTRYENRQEKFRHRYRWRHQRNAVLQQRLTDWQNIQKC